MASLLSWAKKRAQGVVAQVNPWDRGATYNTVLQNRPPPPRPPISLVQRNTAANRSFLDKAIRHGPSAIADISVNDVRNAAVGTGRTLIRIPETASRSFVQLTGGQPQSVNINDPVRRFLYGSEPLETYQKRVEGYKKVLEGSRFRNKAGLLAGLAGVGVVVADIAPIGGPGKGAKAGLRAPSNLPSGVRQVRDATVEAVRRGNLTEAKLLAETLPTKIRQPLLKSVNQAEVKRLPPPSIEELKLSNEAAQRIDAEMKLTQPELKLKTTELRLKPEQVDHIKEYARFLKSFDDNATGGQLRKVDELGGAGQYIRTSEHSPFYRDTFKRTGRPPTLKNWENVAQRELLGGKAESGFQSGFNALNDPNLISLQAPKSKPTPKMSQVERQNLYRTVPPSVPANIKVIGRGAEKQVKIGRITVPKDLIGDVDQWKDVGSTWKTIDRNIEKAAPSETQYRKIRSFVIEPREVAVTNMVKEMEAIKTSLKGAVEQFGLKDKNVRADVMRFGEGKITQGELVSKYGSDQAGKIVEADKWFRLQYGRLLEETNAELRKFGLSEIPKRQNYYTHFQNDNLWSNFGLKVRQAVQRGDVLQEANAQATRGQRIDPRLISASEFTRPKRRFNPYAQRRTGDVTKYDAVEAFEKYLLPTLHNKYLTESVVRTRLLTREFEKATATKGNLPSLINQLNEYGNDLAGKTPALDRWFVKRKGGQAIINTSAYLQRQMGRNTILGSIRSAVMQTAAIPQSIAQAGVKNTAVGLLEGIKSVFGSDTAAASLFLKRRYTNLESVLPSKLRKAENIAGFAFDLVEQNVTKGIWRAQYNMLKSKGLKGNALIREADRLTERVVAGRSIGERPELFRGVIGNTGLQFQIEVNNLIQQIIQDFGIKNPIKLAKLFGATYAFNSFIYEPLFGNRSLVDPVDAAIDTYNKAREGDVAGAIGRLPGELLSNVAGGQLIAGFYPETGISIGGQRLPGRKELFGDTEAGRYGGSLAALTAIRKPLYAIPKTFGLSQAEKTLGGVRDVKQGYSETSSGKIRFPIQNTTGNYIQGGAFGVWNTAEGKKYLQNKDQPLGENQSEQFKALQGSDRAGFFNQVMNKRQVDKEKEQIKKENKPVGTTTPLSTGQVYTKVGDEYRTFDTPAAAQKAIAMDAFDKSGKAVQVVGETVFRRNSEGKPFATPKIVYDYQLGAATLAQQKRKGDVEGYLKTAQSQLENLDRQLRDPTLDPLDVLTLQNRAQTLIDNITKYQNYGGFTKPKAPRRARVTRAPKPPRTPKLKVPTLGKVKVANIKAPKITGIKTKATFKAPRTRKVATWKPPRTKKLSVAKLPKLKKLS